MATIIPLHNVDRITGLQRSSPNQEDLDVGVTEAEVSVFENFVHLVAAVSADAKMKKRCGQSNSHVEVRRSSRLRNLHPAPPISIVKKSNNVVVSRVLLEEFERWNPPRRRMGPRRTPMTKQSLPTSRRRPQEINDAGDEGHQSGKEVQMRMVGDIRSKRQEEKWASTLAKGKGKAKASISAAPMKKQKTQEVNDPSSSNPVWDHPRRQEEENIEEDDSEVVEFCKSIERRGKAYGNFSNMRLLIICNDYNGDTDMANESDDNDDNSTDGEEDMEPPMQRLREVGPDLMRKPISVDEQGQPFGSMLKSLREDVRLFAADLDLTAGWDQQHKTDRTRFYKRLYSAWSLHGDKSHATKLCEQWLGPLITKALIHARWKVNQLIDAGKRRPAEVDREQWNFLVIKRQTEESKQKSAHMRSISQGKGSKLSQLQAIERDVLVHLTLKKNRAPFPAEVEAAVAQEFSRQEEEKRNAATDKGREMEEIRTRMSAFENIIERLQSKVDSSQDRIEDMLGDLLTGRSSKSNAAMADGFFIEAEDVNPVSGIEFPKSPHKDVNAAIPSTEEQEMPDKMPAVGKDVLEAASPVQFAVTHMAEVVAVAAGAPAQKSLKKAMDSLDHAAENVAKEVDVYASVDEEVVTDLQANAFVTESIALPGQVEVPVQVGGDFPMQPRRPIRSQNKSVPTKVVETMKGTKASAGKGLRATKTPEVAAKVAFVKRGESSKKK